MMSFGRALALILILGVAALSAVCEATVGVGMGAGQPTLVEPVDNLRSLSSGVGPVELVEDPVGPSPPTTRPSAAARNVP